MYRLDRLTSGCVILGKNFKSSLIIDKHIKDRTAKKTYVIFHLFSYRTGQKKYTDNRIWDF